jgi:hypothetical protein
MYDVIIRAMLPVLVVSGFLGSGKTTLLTWLLGHRPAQLHRVYVDLGVVVVVMLMSVGTHVAAGRLWSTTWRRSTWTGPCWRTPM